MRPLTSLSLSWARLAVPAAAGLLAVMAGPAAAQAAQAAPAARALPSGQATFTWHGLSLENGWKSASAPKLVTGQPAWALRDGVVYLRGAVRQPSPTASSTFATLPKADRPAHNLYINVFTGSAGVPGVLYIGASGAMEAFGSNAYTFTSLATVSFPTAALAAHNLTLKNGWESSQPAYQTGNPAYAVSDGVVYLSGSLHAGTSALAFVLPKAARPAHLMLVSVYTFDGSAGWLEIQPSGQVDLEGTLAVDYTSLASISFPVASTKWHDFKLIAGWKSGASRFGTAAPSYADVNGVVYLTGSMYQSGGTTGLWTDVPAAARPKDVLEIEVYTSKGTTGSVAMTTLGLVSGNPFSNAKACTSLAGIAYPPSS
jgi:hypothetical protein